MAFLDRFKGKTQDDAGATTRSGPSTLYELEAIPEDEGNARGREAMDMNLSALPATAVGDTSIIAEAAPSEMAPEFDETRLPGTDPQPGAAGSAWLAASPPKIAMNEKMVDGLDSVSTKVPPNSRPSFFRTGRWTGWLVTCPSIRPSGPAPPPRPPHPCWCATGGAPSAAAPCAAPATSRAARAA